MSSRLIKSVCLILGVGILMGGCKSDRENEENAVVLARGPAPGSLSASSEYATGAIDATGGMNAWTRTKHLQLDCVVTFFRPDGSFYLTEQSLRIYPWSDALEISAREPQGAFAWRLSQGRFEVLQGADRAGDLPLAVASRCFAEAILSIVTAPVRLLDSSAEFTRQDAAVKMHGQWYHAVNRKADAAIFYQDRDNSVVDMIQFTCAAKNKSLTVRGYDYARVEKGGLAVPTRIEIFSGGPDAQDRLVKIDCHRLSVQ
ncbi:MAG: hypothetical protein JSW66_15360 [Phycisphaerales bacterium]|nr:MAG: hypothetical protein JSW66_15360 [Phycisphaerales bacterium]